GSGRGGASECAGGRDAGTGPSGAGELPGGMRTRSDGAVLPAKRPSVQSIAAGARTTAAPKAERLVLPWRCRPPWASTS
ncbi:hypothetical protein, partial [Streptomyces clavifer]